MTYHQIRRQSEYQDRLVNMSQEEKPTYLDDEASRILGQNPIHHSRQMSLETLSQSFLEEHTVKIWD